MLFIRTLGTLLEKHGRKEVTHGNQHHKRSIKNNVSNTSFHGNLAHDLLFEIAFQVLNSPPTTKPLDTIDRVSYSIRGLEQTRTDDG